MVQIQDQTNFPEAETSTTVTNKNYNLTKILSVNKGRLAIWQRHDLLSGIGFASSCLKNTKNTQKSATSSITQKKLLRSVCLFAQTEGSMADEHSSIRKVGGKTAARFGATFFCHFGFGNVYRASMPRNIDAVQR